MNRKQLALFLFVFSLDVRSKAEEHRAIESHSNKTANLVSLPEGCERSPEQVPCTVQNKGRFAATIEFDQQKIILYPQSAMTREENQTLRFLSGRAWIHAGHELVLHTTYGDIELRPGARLWLENGRDRFDMRTHEGLVLIQVKGDSKFYELPAGFETAMLPVDKEGKSKLHTPEPVNYKRHLPEMRVAFPDKAEYLEQLEKFSEAWKAAQERSQVLHAQLVEDQLTERKRALAAQAQAKKNLQAERLRYRSMMLENSEK